MNLKIIACRVMSRELSLLSATHPNIIDITYLRQGYHNTPDLLRQNVQTEIDLIESGDDPHTIDTELTPINAILLGYGLCSNGIIGVKSDKYTLVVPRGHDCITMLLGSKERYKEYFDSHRGVYWYTKGWIENSLMPSEERYTTVYNQYVESYGEDNAEYLMEMDQGWYREYEWATFINWPQFDNAADIQHSKDCAEYLKWNFDMIQGDNSLLKAFLSGEWDEERFLVVPPGHEIIPTYDERIIDYK